MSLFSSSYNVSQSFPHIFSRFLLFIRLHSGQKEYRTRGGFLSVEEWEGLKGVKYKQRTEQEQEIRSIRKIFSILSGGRWSVEFTCWINLNERVKRRGEN